MSAPNSQTTALKNILGWACGINADAICDAALHCLQSSPTEQIPRGQVCGEVAMTQERYEYFLSCEAAALRGLDTPVSTSGSITLEQALAIVEKSVNAWKAQNMDLVANAVGVLKADFIVASLSATGSSEDDVPFSTVSQCPSCGGEGWLHVDPVKQPGVRGPCWRCKGSGRVMAYSESKEKYEATMEAARAVQSATQERKE